MSTAGQNASHNKGPIVLLSATTDEQIEQGIDRAYKRLCTAQTKTAKTDAMNEMYALMAQRSRQQVERMEQARQATIRKGG